MLIQSLDELLGARNRPTVLRRLRWIEDHLWWRGSLRRSEVVARFGISPQQASQDIATYQQVQPGFATLVASSKRYVRAGDVPPIFPKDPIRWIGEEMDESSDSILPIERVSPPTRKVDPEVVSTLIASYAQRCAVSIEYQSMSREEPATRTICPHHIVDTGNRYHVRAWDGLRAQFADFVIGRIVSAVPNADYPWVDTIADRLWEETIDVVLAPAENLSSAQRRAVERDYGMHDGRIVQSVRKALVVYLAETLGILDELQGRGDNRVRELRCLNAEALRSFVP